MCEPEGWISHLLIFISQFIEKIYLKITVFSLFIHYLILNLWILQFKALYTIINKGSLFYGFMKNLRYPWDIYIAYRFL